MDKSHRVFDWLCQRFSSGSFRPFTAGECARSSGVSINTAKKWLRVECSASVPKLIEGHKTMNNGIVASVFVFSDEVLASWK